MKKDLFRQGVVVLCTLASLAGLVLLPMLRHLSGAGPGMPVKPLLTRPEA